MEPGTDPLDELRALWRELPPPAPLAGEEARADERDPALAWLAAAWRALEPPPLPAALARRARRPRGRRLAPLAAAAAALALAAAALAALLARASAPGERAPEIARHEEPPAPGPARAGPARAEGASPNSAAPAPPRAATSRASAPPLRPSAILADGIELRSGNVRLILVDPPSSSPTNSSLRDEP